MYYFPQSFLVDVYFLFGRRLCSFVGRYFQSSFGRFYSSLFLAKMSFGIWVEISLQVFERNFFLLNVLLASCFFEWFGGNISWKFLVEMPFGEIWVQTRYLGSMLVYLFLIQRHGWMAVLALAGWFCSTCVCFLFLFLSFDFPYSRSTLAYLCSVLLPWRALRLDATVRLRF